MEAAQRPNSVRPTVGSQKLIDRQSTRSSRSSVLHRRNSAVSQVTAAPAVPLPNPPAFGRDSFNFSEATSGFEPAFLANDLGSQNGSLPFQQSSLMNMMNSDETAFAVAFAASAHASQDSQIDKYDSMVFSDLTSEFAPDF